MRQNNQKCLEAIMSNEYLDIYTSYVGSPEEVARRYQAACYQIVNEEAAILHIKYDKLEFCKYEAGGLRVSLLNDVDIYGPIGIKDKNNSESYKLPRITKTPLSGVDVIIGMIDSGIDYQLPAFRNKEGLSKILSIWDQTIQGNPPNGYLYGTEYTQEEINTALKSNNPIEVVPHTDDTGLGTYLAGIAGGSLVESNDTIGVAPDSELIVVKLKEAKKVMREAQMIFNPSIPTYQDSDIIMGMNYLLEKARMNNKPIVILIGLSSNEGSHDGTSIVEEYIDGIADAQGVVIVVAAGDEADKDHHYENWLTTDSFQDVNINVCREEKGFQLIFMGNAPDIVSVAIISPSGESISRISPQYFVEGQFDFLLERTEICISHILYPGRLGDQVMTFKFFEPTPGLWTLRVFGDVILNGRYDIWLPRQGLVQPETKFLYAQPATTITLPSTTRQCITVGAYNHVTNSLYVASGRGYTRKNIVKPDIVAPGVNIVGPFPRGTYGAMTGTAVAAAIVAGASALLLEWGITQGNNRFMNTLLAKDYLIKGAKRRNTYIYPNNAWGYGELDLDKVFDILKQQ